MVAGKDWKDCFLIVQRDPEKYTENIYNNPVRVNSTPFLALSTTERLDTNQRAQGV